MNPVEKFCKFFKLLEIVLPELNYITVYTYKKMPNVIHHKKTKSVYSKIATLKCLKKSNIFIFVVYCVKVKSG